MRISIPQSEFSLGKEELLVRSYKPQTFDIDQILFDLPSGDRWILEERAAFLRSCAGEFPIRLAASWKASYSILCVR
jgi:hypothetical protein